MKMPPGPVEVDQLLRTAQAESPVYLLGAGGCGMSGLGHLLLDVGRKVAGADLVLNEEIRQLRARGADIRIGHTAEAIEQTKPALVVHTSAVRPDNPEWQEAQRLGIPIVRRAVLLAALLHRQSGICVSGMHGKTTTAALLAFALENLGANPSYAVGALVPQLRPHARFSPPKPGWSEQPHFVIEADESDGTLLQFHPEHAIVLNVDAEHLDHFDSIEVIEREFLGFSEQTRGRLVFCADDPRLAVLFARNPRAVSYGFHPLAAYRAECIRATGGDGATRFQAWHKGELLGEFSLQLIGEQNIANATAVVAMLHQFGFAPDAIARSIANFHGAARRQEELFRDEHFRVFEDYGHHPNEIQATLRAFRALSPKRLLVAFQPHRFSRTQHLWKEFSTCFEGADLLWLGELYPASEPAIPGINSGFLAHAIRAQGQKVEAVLPLTHLKEAIHSVMEPGDLVLFLGAGDITKVAHELAGDLRSALTEPAITVRSAAAPHEFSVMNPQLLATLEPQLAPGTVARLDEPLAKHTTLRVGGKADLYIEPGTEEDLARVLQFCARHSVPFVFLGRGSNLLVRDGGIRGVVICLAHPQFSRISVDGCQLQCGAGAKLRAIASEAARHGLSGLEFLEGIPGSLGGALRMNAGAMGSWLFDVVSRIRFMTFAGEIMERNASEVNVEYRGCPLFKNHAALGALVQGQQASPKAVRARMDAFSKRRWETQPREPSAGCIFKNPGTIPAGRLIDELGLKGTRVGGAVVSEKHGNFIVNDGTATASDVLSLIAIVQQSARSARGIELETEVEILGEG
jgi:UDP-N-acetylmuramate--alanine ligase